MAYLPDGQRLHLHHGPIDLIVDADGAGRAAALRAAARRFGTILEELVGELDLLRAAVTGGMRPQSRVAREMAAAVAPFAPDFVTPMAAVAGAVADEILRVMVAAGPLRRAYVNNGGDVALHLAAGARFVAAVVGAPGGRAVIEADSPVRGVATSGWRGRSHSLGIADSVTVLARAAAQADAAATMIANAVDLPDSAKVLRRPACELSPDSDLGERPVTVDVLPLTPQEADDALRRGAALAEICRSRGTIVAALLVLQGQVRVVGDPMLAPQAVGG
ncbi:UPF0280 family protein [Jhaorihella thermophila]|uniref:UPF0280 family protein n=1 Tax=Jhaorihella thermophila TaxID=488547 RepID=UPI001F2FBF55|nr:UPF0280 family protein [Jhaorihella thermophila]